MPTEKPRYTVTVDEEMLKQIDDFRFENRLSWHGAIKKRKEQLSKRQLIISYLQI